MSVFEQIQRIASTGEDVLRSDSGMHFFMNVYDDLPEDFVVARRRTIARPLGAGMVQQVIAEYPSKEAIAIAREADYKWGAEVTNSLKVSRPRPVTSGAAAASMDTSIDVRIDVLEIPYCIPTISWSGPREDVVAATDIEFWKQWGIVDLRLTGNSIAANTLPNFEELVEVRLSELE